MLCGKLYRRGKSRVGGKRRLTAAFVTISTDYVFDGAKDDFYTQRDTPNPQGVYAKSKLEGEISCAKRLRALDHRSFGLDLRRGRHEFFERDAQTFWRKENRSKRSPILTARRLLPATLARSVCANSPNSICRVFFRSRTRARELRMPVSPQRVCDLKNFDTKLAGIRVCRQICNDPRRVRSLVKTGVSVERKIRSCPASGLGNRARRIFRG
jgi:hypothetical protein